jgi:hypothetical protein
MTVAQAFAGYLESIDVATLGTNLFISRWPSSNQIADPSFLIKDAPGQLVKRTIQGQPINQYLIELYMRSYGGGTVDQTMSTLRGQITGYGVTLTGFTLAENPEVNGPWSDQDLDDEERTVGVLQVKLKILEEA